MCWGESQLIHGLFLRACWPFCPNASTEWTCTIALPTLERWLGRRQAQRGRTFSTSSMNSWVSGPEWWIMWNIHIFCQHCQLLTLGRHAVLIFPQCLHKSSSSHFHFTVYTFLSCLFFLSFFVLLIPYTLVLFSTVPHLECPAGHKIYMIFICNYLWCREKQRHNVSCILLSQTALPSI